MGGVTGVNAHSINTAAYNVRDNLITIKVMAFREKPCVCPLLCIYCLQTDPNCGALLIIIQAATYTTMRA